MKLCDGVMWAQYYIETHVLGCNIGGVLSQLTSGTSLNKVVTKANLSLWHLVPFFSRKMILAEI